MTTAIPERPDQLEEALLDPAKLRDLMDKDGQLDPAKLGAFVKDYTKNVYDRDPGLKAQLKEAVRAGMAEFGERNGVKRLPMDGDEVPGYNGAPRADIYKPLGMSKAQQRQIAATGRGPAVPLAGQWPTFGEYLQAISPKGIERNGIPKILNDMSEAISGDGGFLVPEEFRAELMQNALESAVVRPRARVIPMGSSSVRIPAILDASHASTVFGGVNVLWAAEAASISTVTQPSFAQVLLSAKKLTGYRHATGDVFANMLYDAAPPSALHYPKVVRFHSNDGGLTAAYVTPE